MPRARDQEGNYKPVYTNREILNFLDGEGFTGTRDVADELGCDRSHAYRRLSALADEGRVTGRKIGGTRVWTLAEDDHDNDGETV